MGFTAALSHAVPVHLSLSFHGQPSVSSSFLGSPLSAAAPPRRRDGKRLVVLAKRISGLEEAIRITRKQELRRVTKARRPPPLRPGRVSPTLPVPEHILRPPYVGSSLLPEISKEHQIHGEEGIARMRATGELAARVLEFAGTLVRPSVTTNEIDKAVHEMIIEAGAYPSPLGYGKFPKSVCTSVNECMCHGIPDSRQLQNGDIINIDVTVYLNGYHGDTSKTFFCGDVRDSVKRLVKVTEQCLERGIALCKDGASFKKIGKRISEHAERFGYDVAERFVGHGVGTVFHSEPLILHHHDTNRQMESTQFGSEGFQPKEEQDKGHSSGGSGEKGPSDDMWDVIEPSVFKTPMAEETEPTPSIENAIAKRSGRSLWNIIADISTLKWGSPSETSNSVSRSGKHISSNESAASEASFFTHESEHSIDKPSRNRGHLLLDKKSNRLQVTGSSGRSTRDPEAKPSPSTTRMGSGSTSKRISFSTDESLAWSKGGKSSRASPSGIGITESPSRRIVSQTSATTSTTKSDLVEQVEPFGPAKASEISPAEASGGGELKRRKLQRIQQVPKDRFDEWEEAFTLKSEQRKLDEMFMREALIEAKKAANTWEVPVGAVLVHNGSIIARGYNLVEELRDSTAHAEMICIREASNHLRSWRLADTTLYVTLEPCPMCAGAILQARVSNLVWGAPNKLLGADGSWIRLFPDGGDGGNNSTTSDKAAPPIHPFHPKMNIRRGVLATECAEVMQQFFQLRRKKEKQASKEEREDPSSRLLSTSHPTKFIKKMHGIFHVSFCL